MSSLRPIEYICDDARRVTTRLCRGIGDDPAYWYLRRPVFTLNSPDARCSQEEIDAFQQNHFHEAYWNGERWHTHTPKQFATPEEAFAEWQRIDNQ